MSNNIDSIMSLWSLAAARTEKSFVARIENGVGQFDVSDSLLAGIIDQDEREGEVPFFCMRVKLKVMTERGLEEGIAVITTFRQKGKWVSTLVPGNKAVFMAEQYTYPNYGVLKTLMNNKPVEMPTVHMRRQ